MPKSRVRTQGAVHAAAAGRAQVGQGQRPLGRAADDRASSSLGLAWIVVYYVDANVMPFNGNVNVLIGFGLLGAGFITATRWK